MSGRRGTRIEEWIRHKWLLTTSIWQVTRGLGTLMIIALLCLKTVLENSSSLITFQTSTLNFKSPTPPRSQNLHRPNPQKRNLFKTHQTLQLQRPNSPKLHLSRRPKLRPEPRKSPRFWCLNLRSNWRRLGKVTPKSMTREWTEGSRSSMKWKKTSLKNKMFMIRNKSESWEGRSSWRKMQS